jgi:hypothetical protein
MPDVRHVRDLSSPASLVFAALGEILDGIAEQSGGWKGFAFHVDLGDVHAPDVGYLAIPIALSIAARNAQEHRYEIVITAARHAESFPVFRGTLSIEARDSSSKLRMDGSYEVPMSSLGAFVDATLARGIASRALENFLDDLALAAGAQVDKRANEFMRYAMFQHGVR